MTTRADILKKVTLKKSEKFLAIDSNKNKMAVFLKILHYKAYLEYHRYAQEEPANRLIYDSSDFL